jgi:hypothetical protein
MKELIMPERICKIGQMFQIELRSMVASTGYMCALVHKPDCLLLDGEATHYIPGHFPGQPGKMIFTFVCTAECKERIVFKYVRPWDLDDFAQMVSCPIVCQK